MQKFAYATLASIAVAENIPTMIESKMKDLIDHLPNSCTGGSKTVVINQISG